MLTHAFELRYDQLYLSNYALIHLREEIQRLPGTADVLLFGQRDYSMRIWADPEMLAARDLTPADVVAALQEQNVQVAAGQIGQPPIADGQPIQITLDTLGRLSTPEQFGDIVVKKDDAGRMVRIKDIGRVELNAKSQDVNNRFDGRPTVGLAVFMLPDANALETGDLVKAKMKEMSKEFPEGVTYEVGYDTTPFIRESVNEVFKTLRDAVILVAIVVLIFLQSWRIGDHSAGGGAGRHYRHVRRDGGRRFQLEQPDAVRPGAGHRHRGRRRHRRRRGGRALYRAGHGAARRDHQGDGTGFRADHRRRFRADRGLHPMHVYHRASSASFSGSSP